MRTNCRQHGITPAVFIGLWIASTAGSAICFDLAGTDQAVSIYPGQVSLETSSAIESEHEASSRQELMAHLRRANRAYLNDKFDAAAEGYLKVLRGGIQHPDLYFSLANTYYLSGQKGLAVLFYEKALNIEPSYEKAASNLSMVEKELIDRVEMPDDNPMGDSPWTRFLRGISVNWLTWTFFTFYTLAFAVMIARRLRLKESLLYFLFWLNVPILCLSVIFGGLLANRIYIQKRIHHGVVTSSATSLLEGPERFAKEKMELHEGLKVRLLKQAGEYTRVRLANGVEGFIKRDHLGKI